VNAKKKVSSCGGTGHSRCGEVHRATVRSASMRSNPFSLQVILLCAAPSSVPHPTCLAQDSRAFPPWPCAPLWLSCLLMRRVFLIAREHFPHGHVLLSRLLLRRVFLIALVEIYFSLLLYFCKISRSCILVEHVVFLCKPRPVMSGTLTASADKYN
jgi:hypothetical protein